jgi:hypothetical protein
MNSGEMLAGLVAQAAAQGCDLTTLRAVVEEASEVGAARALARLGLGDDGAQQDLGELRELLGAWRTAKASAWKATVEWTVRLILALLLIGLAVRLNVPGLLR